MILKWNKTIEEKPKTSGWFMTFDYDEQPRPAFFEYCDSVFRLDYVGQKIYPEFWCEITTPETPCKPNFDISDDIETVLHRYSCDSPEYGVSENRFSDAVDEIVSLINK